MKTILLLSISLLLNISICAQDKKPLITFHSSTECFECGTWGLDFFNALRNTFTDDDAVILNIQKEGELAHRITTEISDNFTDELPSFYFNDEKIEVTSTTQDLILEELILKVEAFKEMHPFSVLFTQKPDQNNVIFLNLNSLLTTEVLYPLEFDIRSSFYFIENDKMVMQEGAGIIEHDRLILEGNIDPFGVAYLFAGDDLELGYEYYSSLAGFNPNGGSSGQFSNFEAVIVYWEERDGFFAPVQADILKIEEVVSSIENPKTELDFSFQLNSNSLKLEANSIYGTCVVSLINQIGENIFVESIDNEGEKIKVYREISHLPNGVYYISLSASNGVLTKSFYKM